MWGFKFIVFLATGVVPTQGGGCGLLPRHFDHVRRNRRAQDVIEPCNPLDLLLGRGVRQDDRIVLVLPWEGLPFWMKRSYDFTGKVGDPYDLAARIFETRKLLTHCTSKHTNICDSIHIVLRK